MYLSWEHISIHWWLLTHSQWYFPSTAHYLWWISHHISHLVSLWLHDWVTEMFTDTWRDSRVFSSWPSHPLQKKRQRMCTAKGATITLLLAATEIGNTLKISRQNNKDNVLHTTWAIKAFLGFGCLFVLGGGGSYLFFLVADDFNINEYGIKRGHQRKT